MSFRKNICLASALCYGNYAASDTLYHSSCILHLITSPRTLTTYGKNLERLQDLGYKTIETENDEYLKRAKKGDLVFCYEYNYTKGGGFTPHKCTITASIQHIENSPSESQPFILATDRTRVNTQFTYLGNTIECEKAEKKSVTSLPRCEIKPDA